MADIKKIDGRYIKDASALSSVTINTDASTYTTVTRGGTSTTSSLPITHGKTDITSSNRKIVASDDLYNYLADTYLNSGVQYLGTVNSSANLIKSNPSVGKGDFYRVSGTFSISGETAHVGDIVIAINDKPTTNTSTNWDILHTETGAADTWRAIKVNGTQLLNTTPNSSALNVSAGNNITLTTSADKQTVVISADSGTTYVAGNNIDITDGSISALGYTYDSAKNSMAIGNLTTADGQNSFVEGNNNAASLRATNSHTEGLNNINRALNGHVEGLSNEAYANNAHIEGYANTDTLNASCCHIEGIGNSANAVALHVGGTWNLFDTSALFIIGNGTGDNSNRSNAMLVYPNAQMNIGTIQTLTDSSKDSLNYFATDGTILNLEDSIGDLFVRKAGDSMQGDLVMDQGDNLDNTPKVYFGEDVGQIYGVNNGYEKALILTNSDDISESPAWIALHQTGGLGLHSIINGIESRMYIVGGENGYIEAYSSSIRFHTEGGNWDQYYAADGTVRQIPNPGDLNQKAFSFVKIGNSSIAAATTTDTFEISSGTNITLTTNSANKRITISTSAEANQNAYSKIKVGTVSLDASAKMSTLEVSAGSHITLTTTNTAASKKIVIASDGEANQNAFSYVKVGNSSCAATTTTDTLELVAGANITLTPSGKKITIASSGGGGGNYLPITGGVMQGAIDMDNSDLRGVNNIYGGKSDMLLSTDLLIQFQACGGEILELDGTGNGIAARGYPSLYPKNYATLSLGNPQRYFNELYVVEGYALNGFYQISDERKKNIHGELDLNKAYDLIEKCSTILYDLKSDESHKEQIGVIAQEIEEFFPEIVNTDKDGFKSVDYAKLTVVIMKVLKDLITRVSNIENKIK